jgi:hypothetical protein
MEEVVMVEWIELLDLASTGEPFGSDVLFWVLLIASSRAAFVLGVEATRLRKDGSLVLLNLNNDFSLEGR